MNIRKAKITNEIIPPLLSLFNDYNSNLRTRLKANSFFLSFDEKSKKTFNKFINLSNERFKLMKYGGNLNHILLKQKNNYNKINHDVKNDILFTTEYPSVERKKLIKSVNILKSKEISSMREKLYDTLRYSSQYDKLPRKHTLMLSTENIPKEKKKNKEIIKMHYNTNENLEMPPKEQIRLIQSKTEDAIIEDQKNFKKGLDEYKILLKNKKKELNNKEDKNVIKINKNDFDDVESHIKENSIKVLTYKAKSKDNDLEKIKADTKFDINILYKIKNYRIKNKKNNKNIFPKLKQSETETEDLLNNEKKIFDEYKRKSIFNHNLNTFNNTKDFKNTIGIINEEVQNGVNLGEKFQKQKNKFDREYEIHLGIRNSKNIDEDNLNKCKEIIKGKKITSKPKILKNKKLSENEKIFGDFLRIYEDKKNQWKKVDEENERKRLEKEKEKEEVMNYLFSLKQSKPKKKNFKMFY